MFCKRNNDQKELEFSTEIMNVVYTRKRMAFTEGNKEVMFAIHFERQGAFKYLRNWEDEQNVQKCSCKKSRNYMGKLNCSGALCMLSCNLCNPVDYSSPGSSIHGIFQVKILQWIAISFSKGFSLSRDEIFFFLILDLWMSFAAFALAGRFFTTVLPG